MSTTDSGIQPEGGVIENPAWPCGCPLTLAELPTGGPENYRGHLNCQQQPEPNIQTCADCNSYDDADQPDSFMHPFGDDMWLCDLCREARGIDPY